MLQLRREFVRAKKKERFDSPSIADSRFFFRKPNQQVSSGSNNSEIEQNLDSFFSLLSEGDEASLSDLSEEQEKKNEGILAREHFEVVTSVLTCT